MTKRKDGGPAFARPIGAYKVVGAGEYSPSQEGMSLRDYFAAHALTACVIAHSEQPCKVVDLNTETLASMAYMVADAMLKERMK